MSAVGVEIRAAVAGDVEGIVALERAAESAPHWAASVYAGIVDGDEARCLRVACAGRRVIGFAVGFVPVGESCGEVESVAVEQAARRGGVGRALCEAVVGWCRERGVSEVMLEVRAGSEGAIALYRGMGFVAVGRRVGYYSGPDEDALLMRLNLLAE